MGKIVSKGSAALKASTTTPSDVSLEARLILARRIGELFGKHVRQKGGHVHQLVAKRMDLPPNTSDNKR